MLADRFDGRRPNSPNDAVVHSDGTLGFSDPDFGITSDYEGHRALRVPEAVSDIAFGGPKNNRLFITATTTLYSLVMSVPGAPRIRRPR
ncbi:hypothetical protein ADK74_34575 [Streptomyces decoyicus]|nr:hypothetical protein ADK74_34575 [Streptomyces decoyicus]